MNVKYKNVHVHNKIKSVNSEKKKQNKSIQYNTSLLKIKSLRVEMVNKKVILEKLNE